MQTSRLPLVSYTLLLGMILGGSILAALFYGAYQISIGDVLNALMGQGTASENFLILQIRLPRILLTALTGMGLAISGAAIQGVFRNPLADQTLIGVTSGASLFAVLAIVLMGTFLAEIAEVLKQSTVALFAFTGGFLTTYLVYFLSREQGRTNVMTMLLAGIAISAFAAAISGVFIYMSDDQQLRDITFWTMGSFSGAGWVHVGIAAPIMILGCLFLTRYSRALNAFLLGEKEAMYLGFDVEKVKSRAIFFTALMIGVCTSMCGLIGFVGLVVPHFLRLLQGPDNRYLLIGSALSGAIFLVWTDTLARTIIAPGELPIGILTASIGAPFFLWLLINRQQENELV
ncbi:MAG: iron ABC transporter permease [Bacteroidota bacterium]